MLNHIAFIMDGNRRYSKKNNLNTNFGYNLGMENFLNFIRYQIKYNIKETSFFALSSDNLEKRSEEEKKIIFDLIEKFHKDKEIKKLFLENKVKINLIGDINEIEKKIEKIPNFNKNLLKELQEEFNISKKKDEHKFTVNILLNYDGQKEILNSTKIICEKIKNNEIKIKDINEALLRKHMYCDKTSIPDIIVRPGDAPRLSGFYLWDSKYSEIYLTKKLWPELNEEDFKNIINWFINIKRNFGK